MRSLRPGWVIGLAAASALAMAAGVDHDPYLWLSKVYSPKALDWVKQQNARSEGTLKSDPLYARDREAILTVLNSNERIPEASLEHRWVLNFWQDAKHVRGVWRRAPIAEYASPAPSWQTLLDVDQLDRDTHQNWVWQGAECAPSERRCLVRLSPGGGDAAVVREYDPETRQFLDSGFSLPLAKSSVAYLDEDHLLVATDFGPGSLTPSSYPRIVKLWRRGEPLASAKTLFVGRPNDMSVDPRVLRGPYGVVPLIIRKPSFFRSDFYFVRADGTPLKVPLPQDAQLQGVTQGQLVATLQNDWTVQGRAIKQGSLIALPIFDFVRTGHLPRISVLYTPGAHAMVDDVSAGRDGVYAAIYEDVKGSIHAFRHSDTEWSDTRLNLPVGGSTSVMSTNAWGPEAYFTFQSFLTPPTLYAYAGGAEPQAIRSEPSRFESNDVSVEQYWVTSKDGTRVPYFLLRPRGARGPIPTILYGYGGFQLSLTPWYWNDPHRPLDAGQTWLAHGGAIAVANIRGGNEFGPAWHEAALKFHRQRAYDDFEAVAADLEHRDLTTPKQLGIVGASNGGLLVSTVMVERPQLFAAVVCQRPLIDMLRYTHFGAGASWIGEYGDPADPKMAAYIRTYSPFQNVRANVHYPPILFVTETTDDRVTPVFARMMAAKMQAQGHDVLFYEAAEGGHGAGSTHAQEAEYWALSYVFFARRLGLERPASLSSG
ncbi:MAG TPA: prolyl oligopeptidase family serine peptidase [Steroidobacteraceae bacterium]|nr:prolyl oligopeptidase family serine peptidase [Steroidobacteraceae bacterium]